ncbi:DUF5103 domain-containing protein [uncultured Chitinophaga sp.]|uniref:type IX secretion system plug protein n=1 Tax=uncultured Chitinophaga sp. TaxID=339340 RepID=UPI0025F63A1C|nr:DUF5103 domain-containing protein [uncultured Chitinophaga sp.]
MRTTCSIFLSILLFCSHIARAQSDVPTPDHVYMSNIKTVKLNRSGDYLAAPIITLTGGEKLSLGFDDLDATPKNYFYTIVHCNADWTRSNFNTFDYLNGFVENRIQTSRFSRLTLQRYLHYSVDFPNANCTPLKSGNYILKVYMNSDTSQLAFTRRFLVVDSKAGLSGFISTPINPKFFKTHQKVNFSINTKALNINNPFNQVKVVILQNNRWDNAITGIKPMFVKPDGLEYNAENDCLFPAGKEWRWMDLRSLRLQTERVARAEYGKTGTEIWAQPDPERGNARYFYIKDINGKFFPGSLDNTYDANTEGDYTKVNFVFPSKDPYVGYDLYIFGELTNYERNESNKLIYNGTRQAYEGSLFLKQGFYNYVYGLIDRANNNTFSTEYTEGDWWETENDYTVLVYYRSLGGRGDELVGSLPLNSIRNRK